MTLDLRVRQESLNQWVGTSPTPTPNATNTMPESSTPEPSAKRPMAADDVGFIAKRMKEIEAGRGPADEAEQTPQEIPRYVADDASFIRKKYIELQNERERVMRGPAAAEENPTMRNQIQVCDYDGC